MWISKNLEELEEENYKCYSCKTEWSTRKGSIVINIESHFPNLFWY